MSEKKKVARRKKILNYKDACIGYTLILILAEKRRNNKSAWHLSFNDIKDDVTRSHPQIRVAQYRDLPSDTKSFISRCSGIKSKKENEDIGYLEIARQQLLLVQYTEEELYRGAITEPSGEIENRLHYEASKAWWKEHLPLMENEWYVWAEKNPRLAFID